MGWAYNLLKDLLAVGNRAPDSVPFSVANTAPVDVPLFDRSVIVNVPVTVDDSVPVDVPSVECD